MFDVNDFHMVNYLIRNTFVLIGRVTKFSPTKILYIEDKILFSWEMAYEVLLWVNNRLHMKISFTSSVDWRVNNLLLALLD